MSLVGGNTYLRETYITVTDKKCNFSDMCSRERVSLGIYICSGARISRGNTYHCNNGTPVRNYWIPVSQDMASSRAGAPGATGLHSCQPSRNGRDSPGILGLVPVVSRLSRNLRAPCASAFTRLDGRRSLNRA